MRSKLVLLVAQRGVPDADGRLVLPAKLVDGVATFARYWPGEVVTLLERSAAPDNHLDNRAWAADELPGRFELVDFRSLSATWSDEFNDAIVLAFADHRLHGLARLCHSRAVPYVVNTELSLKTQLQILFNDKQGWAARARSTAWTLANHASTLVTISRAAGLQTNGTPTFDAYRAISPDPLLYFDTRMTASMMAAPADVEARLARNARSKKLRLLFSGRLVKIKGVGHLVDVARTLRASSLDFELLIAGDGPLRKPIEAHAQAAGLQDFVKCLGTLDFKSELVPMLRDHIDLFVCPHLQGDPSCTYLETMSAGVPIVGYANEAFEGVQRASGAGWHVPLGDTARLAAQILHIARHPGELRAHSLAALDFAVKRTFEAEFVRRIDHLLAIRHRASLNQPARALPPIQAEPTKHPSQFGGLSGG